MGLFLLESREDLFLGCREGGRGSCLGQSEPNSQSITEMTDFLSSVMNYEAWSSWLVFLC